MAGHNLFFSLSNGELWRSDGTGQGTHLVKHILQGDMGVSQPSDLTDLDGTVYFSAESSLGTELWKSDGTTAGTVLVKDIVPGERGSEPRDLRALRRSLYFGVEETSLYFAAEDAEHGRELWRSNGTADGTVLVKDIVPGPDGSSPTELTVVNGLLFFVATDGRSGRQLWKSDGTDAGTVLVKDLTANTQQYGLTEANGRLYFFSSQQGGCALWTSDGTPGGTLAVRGFVVDYYPSPILAIGVGPSALTESNGNVFFLANDGLHGRELWRSDGTAAGTLLVKDIAIGPNGSTGAPDQSSRGPRSLVGANGLLFFGADDGVHGFELWRTDGTAAGSFLARDIAVGQRSSDPGFLTAFDGTIYFGASDEVTSEVASYELWRSDGTEAGTVMVRDINPGPIGSDPQFFTPFNGSVFFAAYSADGFTLWQTDGTANGTAPVRSIAPNNGGSFPSRLTDVGGVLFFTASEGYPWEDRLWRSEGTSEETRKVADLIPRFYSLGVDGPGRGGVLGTTFFYAAGEGRSGIELWKSDGTLQGTRMVKDIWPGANGSFPRGFATWNRSVFFVATAEGSSGGLWKTDGTKAGTVRVKEINRGPGGAFISQFTPTAGALFFAASDGMSGLELWKTDGTEAGTTIVKDLNPGANSSFPRELTDVNGTLFFTASVPGHRFPLWKSDGSAAGTVALADRPDWMGRPQELTNVDGTLYFFLDDDSRFDSVSSQLWKSDGTDAGTRLVEDFTASGVLPRDPTSCRGMLFFTASVGALGLELWRSDGTPEGTAMVEDITPGSEGSSISWLSCAGDVLVFAASDDVHGLEPWKSDGTSEGTSMIQDIAEGPASSLPRGFTRSGALLFFSADDNLSGFELWAQPLSALSAPMRRGRGMPFRNPRP